MAPCDRLASDRKSTRLNSSHLVISYAVFCLKKTQPAPVPAQVTALDPNSPIRMDYELAAQINTQAGWDSFLTTYPKGFFLNLARPPRIKFFPPPKPFVA